MNEIEEMVDKYIDEHKFIVTSAEESNDGKNHYMHKTFHGGYESGVSWSELKEPLLKISKRVRSKTLQDVKEVLEYLNDDEVINRVCKLVDSLNEEVNIKSVKKGYE